MKKILISPLHFLLLSSYGSELGWAYYFYKTILNSDNKEFLLNFIVGNDNSKISNHNVIKVYKKLNLEQTYNLKTSIFFTFRIFIYTLIYYIKNKPKIIHHFLPFAIGRTINIGFIFGLYRTSKLVIGPIQAPLYFHNNNLKKGILGKILFFLSKKTLLKVNKIIVINKFTKNILINLGISNSKILIIPTGIMLNNEKKTSKNINNEIYFITVSYLIKRKRIDLLIKSFAKLITKNKKVNLKLRIVGDGPERKNLEILVNKLGIKNNIIFEGLIKNELIGDFYKKSHIFVTMSESESWGQMYLEAMKEGLPIISYANVGAKSIIKDNKFGFLIYGKNEKDIINNFLEKSEELIFNKNKYNNFSVNSLKEIKKYSWELIINKYFNLYKNIIKGKIN